MQRRHLIAAALAVLGVAIEFAQGMMGLGREADPMDVLANCTGIAIGIVLALTPLGRWPLFLERLLGRSGQ